MQATTKRQQTWDLLKQTWDIIVIGGGVTGAGVFRRAVSAGFRTLLVEQADFSSGTSSKSSKLVHGGFRYLRNKQYAVTRESVKQREHLLRESPNLVTPLAFMGMASAIRNCLMVWAMARSDFSVSFALNSRASSLSTRCITVLFAMGDEGAMLERRFASRAK